MTKDKKIKILFVEDDENLGFVTKDNLEELGYDVSWEKDGVAGLSAFEEHNFDLCVFDVMLPLMDGFTMASKIRTTNKSTPILFLTAKSLDQDKIKGFNLGGDDYVTKPFNIELLHLRIQALYKRSNPFENIEQNVFNIGNLTFNYNNQTISQGEESEKLSNKEAEIFRLLCVHKNKVLSREVALTTIWGENDYFKGRSMDVFVARLRKVLKMDDSLEITTVHGKGFQLNEKL